jgi:hypothetical protein
MSARRCRGLLLKGRCGRQGLRPSFVRSRSAPAGAFFVNHAGLPRGLNPVDNLSCSGFVPSLQYLMARLSLEPSGRMRCLSCGAEMRLEQVAGDDTAPVPGFERRTYRCSACGDVEERRVFSGQAGRTPADPVMVGAAPPISPAATIENENPAAPAFAKRILATFNRAWYAVAGRKGSDPLPVPPKEASSDPWLEPSADRPSKVISGAETALLHPAEPLAAPAGKAKPSPPDSEFDECEALLRRAIEMVHGDMRPEPGSRESGSPDAGTIARISAEIETDGSSDQLDMPFSSADGGERSEPGAGPTPSGEHSPNPAVTDAIAPLVPPVIAAPAEKSPKPVEQKSTPIVVQIHHDHSRGKFVAKDTRSGLGVLRHEDATRLRAMCERMGWQVIEG